MLPSSATEADTIQAFNRVLADIISGKLIACPSDTGIDGQTEAVLNALASQPMPKRASDILACRTEFARQLDGTHLLETEEL